MELLHVYLLGAKTLWRLINYKLSALKVLLLSFIPGSVARHLYAGIGT